MRENDVPRIGPKLSQGEELYNQFVDSLLDAVQGVSQNGGASQLVVMMGSRTVTIKIYDSKEGEKAFTDPLQKAARGEMVIKNRGDVKVNETELEPT